MVVAVAVMRMMQVPIDEIVDVIAVGNGRMPAAGPVDVACVVSLAVVSGASVRVGVRYLQRVLVVVAVMSAVQVPVMQIADVVTVLNGNVAAVGSMLVGVVFVYVVVHFPCS